MSHHHHDPNKPELDAILRREDEILHEDQRIEQQNREILRTEREDLRVDRETHRDIERIEQQLRRHPNIIKIAFQGATMADAVAGPITLTEVGQKATASVIVYDQFGNVFVGNFPNPTFTTSDTDGKVATFDPISGLITAVGNGVNAITGTLIVTGADGNPVTLTDTETVTVALAVVPPVPTTIKVAFTQA